MATAGEGTDQRRLMASLTALWRLIGQRAHRRLIFAIPLMLAAAITELATIGAVLPLLALLLAEGPPGSPTLPPLAGLVTSIKPERLVLYAVLFLATAALLSAALRLAVLRYTQSITREIAHQLGTMLFGRLLHQPYEAHLRRNPSEVIAALEKVQVVTMAILQPLLMAVVAAVTAAGILALLLSLEPAAALGAGGLGALGYFAMSQLSRRKLDESSRTAARSATARYRAVQEAIGGIREIILSQSQSEFKARFQQLDAEYRQAQQATVFIGQAPRYLIEAAGIVLISLFILYVSGRPEGLVGAIPMLGVVALSAQRLLPLLQQIYSGWSYSAGNLQSVRDLVALLEEPLLTIAPPLTQVSAFRTSVRFEHVSLSYARDQFVLKDVSFEIQAGQRVGLVGPSGSGKSTLVDLLSGLLRPSGGRILIDGLELTEGMRPIWWAQIAVVPQDVYLPDRSVWENIAFGIPLDRIDRKRVRKAAAQASIDGFIAKLPSGYDTAVGERGIALSGGQRQRIAIARALYRNARLLIFDEATSALDATAEAEVMDSTSRFDPGITVFVVSHRSAPLAVCDVVISLDSGRILRIDHAEPENAIAGGTG